jgi:hypothetical protein
MDELTLVREAGPEAPAFTPAARQAARAALLAEIDRPAGRPRVRRPRRRTVVRLGAGLVAVAAAWTTAVLVAPETPGTPTAGVTLVGFHVPTFPLSLDPVPDGLRPAFDGDGSGSSIASYDDAAEQNGFAVSVAEDRPGSPDEGAPGYRSEGRSEVTVSGEEGQLARYSRTWCAGDSGGSGCGRRSFTVLTWERAGDQWVRVTAYGRYGTDQRVLDIARSLVDRPQPATLQVGLAPAGWSVQSFKMGRVLTLVDDADGQQTLTIHLPLPEDVVPADLVRARLEGPVGPLVPVTVHGRPAQLVRVTAGWYLQAQFADGTTFVVQAPGAFAEQQVLEFAEQVTHTA